jgi:hypothetical protein
MQTIYRIMIAIILFLLLFVCFLYSVILFGTKDGLYWKGEVDYLLGKYEDALTTYDQALSILTDTSDSKFFCAPFRASARLYVTKTSATSQTIMVNRWEKLARRFPNELDKCLKDTMEIPPWDKLNDDKTEMICKALNLPCPHQSEGTAISTPTSTTQPAPTYTAAPTSTLTPTPTRFPGRSCVFSGRRIYGDPILLHPKVDRAFSVDIPRIFGINQIIVNWPSNKNIIACLASSPNGQGDLSVDDQIELKVSHEGKTTTWILNFYDPTTTGIGKYPSQDITWMFNTGTNMVDILLHDTRKDYYYAEPVWLIIWQSP